MRSASLGLSSIVSGEVASRAPAQGAARKLARYWLIALFITLLGYALWGKPWAYLGVPPLFIGEIVLLCGLLVVLDGVRRPLQVVASSAQLLPGAGGLMRHVVRGACGCHPTTGAQR